MNRAPSNAHHPKHAARMPFALLVVGLIVGGLTLLLALNTASAANELRRHELAVKDAELSAQLQQLRNEVAAKDAPGALASAAAALGMVPAVNPAFITIDAAGRIRVLGNPAPATAVLPPPVVVPKPKPTRTPTHARSTARSTRTPTATATSTRTATSTATTTGRATPTRQAGTTPSPTPSGTPTQTLPGGPR